MKILKGHVSPETAYLVPDYPYGFRKRCQIRYWLDYREGFGFRFMSQTLNPKTKLWNKPKASTYAKMGAIMYLNDDGHVYWTGLTEYTTGAEAKSWSDLYRSGVPNVGLATLDMWVGAKLAYDETSENRKNRLGL